MVHLFLKYAILNPKNEAICDEKAFWCDKFVNFKECHPFDKSVMYRHLFLHYYKCKQTEKAMEYGFKTLELDISLDLKDMYKMNRFAVKRPCDEFELILTFFLEFSEECYKQKM